MHLGNVLVTVTDMKIGIEGAFWTAEYYEATVVSVVDYYPFGSAMAGRKYNQGSYRYGFNGMEKDDEVKGEGNSYTTHYRLLDTRIGRWLSTDPVIKAQLNPYNSMSNNPIMRIDPRGDDDYYDKNGQYLGSFGEGNAIRLIHKARNPHGTFEYIANRYKEGIGIEKDLNDLTVEVQVMSDEDLRNTITTMYNDSKEKQVERKAYMVLDVSDIENPKLTLEVQDIGPKDTNHNCENNFFSKERNGKAYRKTVDEEGNRTILGQLHIHTPHNKKSVQLDPFGGQLTEFSETLSAKASKWDYESAINLDVNVYAVDNQSLYVTTPEGEENNSTNLGSPSTSVTNELLRENLRKTGEKQKETLSNKTD